MPSNDSTYFSTLWNSPAGGTVTTVSVTAAAGVSGSVVNPTTTPAITIALGALLGVISLNGLVITANTGVITTGIWNGALITGTYGGTGVNNGTSLITISGNLTVSGAFATTFTITGATTVTLPTTGTLATLANAEVHTNKDLTSATNTFPASLVTLTGTQTLTNKRNTKRINTVASSATPAINSDTTDLFTITALAVNITSFTTSLTGTPTDGQTLWIAITDNATPRTLAWGTSFEASTVALPTTTVASARLDVGFVWNLATSKWRCVATA